MNADSKELPEGRLPSNLVHIQDEGGMAAALLRRGIDPERIEVEFGLSEASVNLASRHILSSDEGVSAFLEAILLRLATGYWTTVTAGHARRAGPTEKKVWHPPDKEAIKMLFDALDRKRLGQAGRTKPLPTRKPRKAKGHGLPSITLASDGELPTAKPDNKQEITDD